MKKINKKIIKMAILGSFLFENFPKMIYGSYTSYIDTYGAFGRDAQSQLDYLLKQFDYSSGIFGIPNRFPNVQDFEEMMELIKQGANPNTRTKLFGYTPLHFAVQEEYNEVIVEFLLKHPQIDVNVRTKIKGYTPLHLAVRTGNASIAETLVQYPNIDVNVKAEISGYTPLHFAALKGNPFIVKILVKSHQINIEAKAKGSEYTPLHTAVVGNNEEVVKILIQAGASVDAVDVRNWVPEHLTENLNILTMLRQVTSEIFSTKMLSNLLNRFDDALFGENSTLDNLPSDFDFQEIMQLIADGANANVKTKLCHYTPLHFAVAKGDISIVEPLLQLGAKVDAIDFWGRMPEHLTEDANIINMLWQATAKIDSEKIFAHLIRRFDYFSFDGRPNLNKLPSDWDFRRMLQLIENGVDVNESTRFGCYTPLHLAAAKGDINIVKALIQENANVDAIDFCGRTPVDLAENQDVIDVLTEAARKNS